MMSSCLLEPGDRIAGKYEVLCLLGRGWEGEAYKVRELGTGVERAAKLFFPARNPGNKWGQRYARKLHRLRNCPVVIGYHAMEVAEVHGEGMTLFVSEYVEGELLTQHVSRHRGGRLPLFQGLHLLHALARGIEGIHSMGEYHGDLHSDNVIVQKLGLHYELRLLDMFNWGRPNHGNRQHDICSVIRIFYDAVGGAKYYRSQPPWVKGICCGLKKGLIERKFRTADQLCKHIGALEWHTGC